jgi:hypothetical protein
MSPFELGRLMADFDRRLAALETWRTWQKQTARAVFKRATIICAVISLAVLANAFPNTEVAKYADQFRLALMRR